MSMFRKAQRAKARLRMAIYGPSGSGKTYSALKVGFGLGHKIVVIDSENGSADLYAHLGDYDVYTMQPPYEPEKLMTVIKEAEKEGYDVIIVDSLTHYWAGEGGLLERHDKMGGNSYTAWGKITPIQQRMTEAFLKSPAHIIVTMRAKQDYVLQDKNGKQVPEKVGLAPVQRDGLEYEFTLAFQLNMHHLAEISKDRTGLFDERQFVPDESTGKTLLDWLEKGIKPTKYANKDQLTEIFALAKQHDSVKQMPTIIKDRYGVMDSKQLTEEQATDLIGWMKEEAAKNEVAATKGAE